MLIIINMGHRRDFGDTLADLIRLIVAIGLLLFIVFYVLPIMASLIH